MEIAKVLAGRSASDVVGCDRATSVRDAVRLLADNRIGALPVLDGGEVVGIFSERDMVYCLGATGPGEPCLDQPVGDIMTAPAITIEPRSDLLEALALMSRRRIRHLPVVADGALVGFISIGDLVKARLDEIQYEANALRTYIQTA